MIQVNVGFVGCAQHMRKWLGRGVARALSASACALLLSHCGAAGDGVHHDVISHGQFLRVQIYRPDTAVASLVLLLSGDGGWDSELNTLAQRLARRGILVAGIDVREWLETLARSATSCSAPGAYLADLGRYLQVQYRLSPSPPLLIGHSAGATLAYVALAQSRPRDFAGAITLSFCADLDLARPLCSAPSLHETPRSAGVRLIPGGALPAPWIGLHWLDDRECPAEEARAFAAAIPDAHFVPLPGQGHTYDDPDRWWGPFIAAYQQLTAAPLAGTPAR
jgi:type IV secretory pathway VirJ component